MNFEIAILKTFWGTPVNNYPGKGKMEKDVVFCSLKEWDIPIENFTPIRKESRMVKPVNFPPVGGEKKTEVNKCN